MGNVVKLKIKYVSVVACCETCNATWIGHIREREYKDSLKGKKKICIYCGSVDVYYCTNERPN